jgi:hypothetical protein
LANSVLYGLHTIEDAAARRVDEVGIPVVSNAIQAALAEHNRQVDSLFNLFVRRTTDFKTIFRSGINARLQPLDEQGRARPIQTAGRYDIALPLQKGGVAWGANRESRAKMTVQQVNDTLAGMFMADNRWVRDHILAALYANAAWTFPDDEHGALTIVGLANGDSVIYGIQAGGDTGSTDTHYLAQAGAVLDASDPYPVLYKELAEHPENNGGEFLALIPTNLKAATQALAGFFKAGDPNIALGSGSDQLVGRFSSTVPGTVLGYHDSGIWIAEWASLPSDYIVGVATGGERAISMREHPEATLQGFGAVAERENHPFWEQHYERIAGFGGWNRVGAAVYRVGNGTYAVPTGFSSPMP